MTKIAIFVGSLREKSHNTHLAKSLEALAPKGVEFVYADLNLPLFNQDLEGEFPPEAQKVKDLVESADGVLFVTPEYNRSVPGVLKNAIDWASRPWGKNSFAGKPSGIVGASIGQVGTAVSQADLRHILAYLGTKHLSQPEVYMANMREDLFDDNGMVVDDHWRDSLKSYVDTFVEWVDKEK